MRSFRPVVLRTLTAAALVAGAVPALSPVGASAQSKAAAPADVTPKPVTLTQAQVDSAVATQKAIRAFEEKQPQDKGDKPDPKAEAALEAIVKKNGFADMDTYANVSATIGLVMAGIDPRRRPTSAPPPSSRSRLPKYRATPRCRPRRRRKPSTS